MMQILDNEKEQQIIPVFRLAFRPFFSCGQRIFGYRDAVMGIILVWEY